jgi:hypothetical protein
MPHNRRPAEVALPAEVPVVAWDAQRGVFLIQAEREPAWPPPPAPLGRSSLHKFHRPFAPEAMAASRRRRELAEQPAPSPIAWQPPPSPAARVEWLRRWFGLWA